jgi:hypothetical protein
VRVSSDSDSATRESSFRAAQECGVNAGLDGSQVLAPSAEQNIPSRAEKLLAYEMAFKQRVREILRLNV